MNWATTDELRHAVAAAEARARHPKPKPKPRRVDRAASNVFALSDVPIAEEPERRPCGLLAWCANGVRRLRCGNHHACPHCGPVWLDAVTARVLTATRHERQLFVAAINATDWTRVRTWLRRHGAGWHSCPMGDWRIIITDAALPEAEALDADTARERYETALKGSTRGRAQAGGTWAQPKAKKATEPAEDPAGVAVAPIEAPKEQPRHEPDGWAPLGLLTKAHTITRVDMEARRYGATVVPDGVGWRLDGLSTLHRRALLERLGYRTWAQLAEARQGRPLVA